VILKHGNELLEGDFDMFSSSTGRWHAQVKVGMTLLACFLMVGNCLYTQTSAEPLLINYTSGNRLNCLALGDGHVWLGAQGGLVRFNPQTGQRVTFTPADWRGTCSVAEVVIDSRGVLWASHEDLIGNHEPGVVEFDGVEWHWHEVLPEPGAPAKKIYGLAADELGCVWFLYGGYVVRFDGAAWHSWQPYVIVGEAAQGIAARRGRGWGVGWNTVCMFEGFDASCTETIGEWDDWRPTAPDRDDGVWFTTCGSRLVYYDGESFTAFDFRNAEEWASVGLLRIDNNNTKWVLGLISGEPGYSCDAASLSQDGVWQVYRDVWPSFLNVDGISDLRFDLDNTAWVTSVSALNRRDQLQPFLIRYDGQGLESFSALDPVVDTKVEQLCIDAAGGAWFTTHDWGSWGRRDYLTHLRDGNFDIFWPGQRELPNMIHSIAAAPNGDVWFGTEEGLYMFDGEQWHCHSEASVTKVKIAPDGDVWIIWKVSQYERRAQRFDGTTWWNAYRPDWWAQELSDIAFDSNGVVWFSCEDALFDTVDDDTWDGYGGIRSWDGESRAYATGVGYDAIAVDQNDVVWATYGRLARIENGRDEIVPWEQVGNCFTYGPLLIDSQGRKWSDADQRIGIYDSRPGLLCIDGDDQVRFYSTSDGLCSGEINDIDEDAYGNIWVSTGRGISVLLEESCFELGAGILVDEGVPPNLDGSLSLSYLGPATNADLYVALQAPSGQIFYIAPQEAEPPFPIFYAAFDGSTEFLQPGPDYDGPGSIPNTPDMKDLAPPPVPLPDPPDGQGPTGLALFAYPVPYFANVPLPAYSAIDDLVLLNTTIPENAPTGTSIAPPAAPSR